MTIYRMLNVTFLLSFYLLLSCNSNDYSKLSSEQSNAQIRNFLKGTIIIGTYGRAGSGGGIENLTRRLQNELFPLGLPKENLYWQSWNKDDDDKPGPKPTTGKHMERIENILAQHGLSEPKYIALIGHSFGGWASARMSRKIYRRWNIKANRVFLLDPVIYVDYRLVDSERKVKAVHGINWYQDNGITPKDVNNCLPISSCDVMANISCGQEFFGDIRNIDIEYRRYSDGSYPSKVNCPLIGRKKRKQTHTTIDDDGFLQQKIFDAITRDIRLAISNIKEDEIRNRNRMIAIIETLFQSIFDRSPSKEEMAVYLTQLANGTPREIIEEVLKEKKKKELSVLSTILSIFLS